MYYVAFVCADDTSIGFTVPDIPGFTVDVDTTDMDDAVMEATAVLAGHLAEMKAAGIDIPKARSLSSIRTDPECAEDLADAIIVFLPALTPMGRTVRVNLSLDEGSLAIIDREAKERGLTRSRLVQEMAGALVQKEKNVSSYSPFWS